MTHIDNGYDKLHPSLIKSLEQGVKNLHEDWERHMNKFIETLETEPMTKTETTTVTTKTERTAEDILSDLREGTYITKNNRFIVSLNWCDKLHINLNPSRDNTEYVLSEETVEELSEITNLIEANRKKKSAEWNIKDAVRFLTKTEI